MKTAGAKPNLLRYAAEPTAHLSDDEFAQCLTGEMPTAAIREHLAACERCRAEMEGFSSTLSLFSEATLDWSRHRRAVALQRAPEHSVALPGRLRTWGVAGSLAAAALLGLAVRQGIVHHEQAAAAPSIAAVRTPANGPLDSPAQIAQDNALMHSVDMALLETEPSPAQAYGLQARRQP